MAQADLGMGAVSVTGIPTSDLPTVETDHTVKLKGGATIKGASAESQGLVTNNGTLEVSGPATLQDLAVTNTSATGSIIQVDDSLTLDDVTISGGAINGTGTIDIARANTCTPGTPLSPMHATARAKL